jgi:hypothetical protein
VTKIQRERVKVTMHLPGNHMQGLIVVEWTYGLGMADGGIYCEIPTEIVDPNLRAIGSSFILTLEMADEGEMGKLWPEGIHASREWTIEELKDE